jgi:chromosome segregation ATPase
MSAKSKKSAVDAATKAEVLNKAAQVDVESIRKNLADGKTQVARQFVEIEEALVVHAERLQAVNAAIAIKQQEMKDLHGADNVLMSIDDLRVKLDAEKASFEAAKDTLEQETERLQAEALEARDREQAEYEYDRDQERKRDADAWNDSKAQRAREEKLRTQDFERDFALRTAELARKEADYKAALEQADTFDAKVAEAAKDKAEAQIGAITHNHNHKVAITKAETDAQISNLNKDIAHHVQTIATLQADMASLKTQLSEAIASQTALARSVADAGTLAKAQGDAIALMTNLGQGGSNGARPRG